MDMVCQEREPSNKCLKEESVSSKIDCTAILANTNTVFNAVSFNKKHNLLAQCCANTILISDPLSEKRVFCSLNQHSSRVNSVAWLGADLLVSVAESIIIWELDSKRALNIPLSEMHLHWRVA